MGTRNPVQLEMSVAAIQVGVRHRRDMGDLDTLAASIRQHGLMQAITVTPDGLLVCGARRLAAVKLLEWKTVTVTVKPDASDALVTLLGEREDNLHHKQLNPIEASELYDEIKESIAEDNAQRQRNSRFGSEGRKPRSDGGEESSPPSQGRGDSRTQAAEMAGKHYSFETMEKTSWLRRTATDEETSEAVRAAARAALDAIGRGEAVSPNHAKARLEALLHELSVIAEDRAEAASVRDAAMVDIKAIREAADAGVSPVTLVKNATAALDRVEKGRMGPAPEPRPLDDSVPKPGRSATGDLRGFMNMVRDLPTLLGRFDPVHVATELDEPEWQVVTDVLDALTAFRHALAKARNAIKSAA